MGFNLKEKISTLKEVPIETYVKVGLSSALVIVGAVVTLIGQNQISSYNASYAQNAETIKQLSSQLTELSEQKQDTSDDVYPKLSSAAEAGNTVAEYQTEYASIISGTDTDMFNMNMSAISNYVKSDAAVGPWYEAASGTVKYTWKFNSTYSFSGDFVPVLWTCVTEDDVLLAYTTGEYNASTGTFTHVEPHVTSIGEDYIDKQNMSNDPMGNSSESDGDEALDRIQDIIDSHSTTSQADSSSVSDSTSATVNTTSEASESERNGD